VSQNISGMLVISYNLTSHMTIHMKYTIVF